MVDDSLADYSEKNSSNVARSSSITAGSLTSAMEQCQQLMAFLQSQLGISPPPQIQTPSPDNISVTLIHSAASSSQITPPQFTGTISFKLFVATITSLPSWLIDTGATHQVCCNLSLIDSYSPVNDLL